jgi:hypothetical protein
LILVFGVSIKQALNLDLGWLSSPPKKGGTEGLLAPRIEDQNLS